MVQWLKQHFHPDMCSVSVKNTQTISLYMVGKKYGSNHKKAERKIEKKEKNYYKRFHAFYKNPIYFSVNSASLSWKGTYVIPFSSNKFFSFYSTLCILIYYVFGSAKSQTEWWNDRQMLKLNARIYVCMYSIRSKYNSRMYGWLKLISWKNWLENIVSHFLWISFHLQIVNASDDWTYWQETETIWKTTF